MFGIFELAQKYHTFYIFFIQTYVTTSCRPQK